MSGERATVNFGGTKGDKGAKGDPGVNAHTVTIADFEQPSTFSGLEGLVWNPVLVLVESTEGWAPGQAKYIEGGGHYVVSSVDSAAAATLRPLSTPNAEFEYVIGLDVEPGETIAAGATVSPSGVIGPQGETGEQGVAQEVQYVSSDTTLERSAFRIVYASGNGTDVTLPAIPQQGDVVIVKKTSASGHVIKVLSTSPNIEGAVTELELTNSEGLDSLMLTFDAVGNTWRIASVFNASLFNLPKKGFGGFSVENWSGTITTEDDYESIGSGWASLPSFGFTTGSNQAFGIPTGSVWKVSYHAQMKLGYGSGGSRELYANFQLVVVETDSAGASLGGAPVVGLTRQAPKGQSTTPGDNSTDLEDYTASTYISNSSGSTKYYRLFALLAPGGPLGEQYVESFSCTIELDRKS